MAAKGISPTRFYTDVLGADLRNARWSWGAHDPVKDRLYLRVWEDEVVKQVNAKRAAGATCGGVAKPKVAALSNNEKLRCASRLHSQDMGTNNFMGHNGSNGSSPWDRMVAAGYNWSAAAENVAAGYGSPTAVVDGWMKSTGHCNNIMGGNLKDLGVGYFYAPNSTYKHYWTQDFGSPR